MLLLKACDRVQLIFVKAADDTVYLGAVLLGRRVAVAYTGVCASLFFFYSLRIVHVYKRVTVVYFR